MTVRQFLIRAVTFLGGIYFFLIFVLPGRLGGDGSPHSGFALSDYQEPVSNAVTLVSVMTIGVGLYSLLRAHGSKLAFFLKGWPYSLALLLGLGTMLTVNSMQWLASLRVASKAEEITTLRDFAAVVAADPSDSFAARVVILANALDAEKITIERDIESGDSAADLLSAAGNDALAAVKESSRYLSESAAVLRTASLDDRRAMLTADQFAVKLSGLASSRRSLLAALDDQRLVSQMAKFLNEGLFIPLGSAMFALLGFYIAAAAYRAFRVRTLEAGLMMLAALVVMLGQIPFGRYISEFLPDIRLWILQYPSSGAARAIEMGSGVAGLVMAVRIWLSIESETYK